MECPVEVGEPGVFHLRHLTSDGHVIMYAASEDGIIAWRYADPSDYWVVYEELLGMLGDVCEDHVA